jgi:iron complex transport system ATP-binding protein
MTEPLIEARDAGYQIEGHSLIEAISLRVQPGEMLGLIGPNGAGKSSLLRLLGGLWKGSGEIVLEGRPLSAYTAQEVAQHIAHVPQNTHLEFAFSVEEIVLMGRSPHLRRFQIERPEDRAIAREAMRLMEIQPLSDRIASTLSGGERQRVFLARALAQSPRLLLLDEPIANLDVRHQLDVMEIVQGQAKAGLGVIMALHDLSLAATYCDRIAVLDEGRLIREGKPAEVLTPDLLRQVFRVEAKVYPDPFNGALRISLGRPAAG